MQNDETARAAYEADCQRCPTYPDGGKRRAWPELSEIAQESWRRNPTPRNWGKAHG